MTGTKNEVRGTSVDPLCSKVLFRVPRPAFRVTRSL